VGRDRRTTGGKVLTRCSRLKQSEREKKEVPDLLDIAKIADPRLTLRDMKKSSYRTSCSVVQ